MDHWARLIWLLLLTWFFPNQAEWVMTGKNIYWWCTVGRQHLFFVPASRSPCIMYKQDFLAGVDWLRPRTLLFDTPISAKMQQWEKGLKNSWSSFDLSNLRKSRATTLLLSTTRMRALVLATFALTATVTDGQESSVLVNLEVQASQQSRNNSCTMMSSEGCNFCIQSVHRCAWCADPDWNGPRCDKRKW